MEGGRVDRTALALPSERLLCSLMGQTLMLFFSREDTDAQSCRESCPRSQTPRAKCEFNSPTPPQVSGPSREGLGLLLLLLEKGAIHPEHLAHTNGALFCPTCGPRNATEKRTLRLTRERQAEDTGSRVPHGSTGQDPRVRNQERSCGQGPPRAQMRGSGSKEEASESHVV